MSDQEPERNSFEDIARALADEVSRAMERLSDMDMEELARTASAEAERARHWVEELGGWLREQGDSLGNSPFGGGGMPWDPSSRSPSSSTGPAGAAPSRAEDPLRDAGPDPLDLPTTAQGRALAALDSGRWRLEPGTATLAVHGEGPGPSDALGLVRELRVRDWLSADGEITLAGRSALRRWLEVVDH